jgi:hypothetical protein
MAPKPLPTNMLHLCTRDSDGHSNSVNWVEVSAEPQDASCTSSLDGVGEEQDITARHRVSYLYFMISLNMEVLSLIWLSWANKLASSWETRSGTIVQIPIHTHCPHTHYHGRNLPYPGCLSIFLCLEESSSSYIGFQLGRNIRLGVGTSHWIYSRDDDFRSKEVLSNVLGILRSTRQLADYIRAKRKWKPLQPGFASYLPVRSCNGTHEMVSFGSVRPTKKKLCQATAEEGLVGAYLPRMNVFFHHVGNISVTFLNFYNNIDF